MEERGSGARAPRHPMRKRMTSSLERQQNLSGLEVPEDEEGRLGLIVRLLLLLLLDVSAFLSHLPL